MKDSKDLVARSMHDIGIAGWFGSTVMGALAVNRATGDLDDPTQVGRVTNGVWRRWWPVNLVFVIAHLMGGAVLTKTNASRIASQSGVGATTAVKSAVTVAAVGAATYSGWLGKKISDAGDVAMRDGTTPAETTPDDVASALRQQSVLQFVLPVLTGVLVVLGTLLGEQQRPTHIASGVLHRLNPAS